MGNEEEDDSTSSEDNISSSSTSMSPRSPCSFSSDENIDNQQLKKCRKKVEIPLLPLHQINNFSIQTNVKCESTNVRTRDSLNIYLYKDTKEEQVCNQEEIVKSVDDNIEDIENKQDDDMDDGGIDGDDEREESSENTQNSVAGQDISNAEHAINANDNIKKNEEEIDDGEDIKHFKQWIPLNDDEYITFRRGDDDDDDADDDMDGSNLMYIDSFLQSISVSNHGIDAKDISLNIEEDEDDRDMTNFNKRIGSNYDDDNLLDNEELEEFRRRDLNDYLVQEQRRTGDREKDWWMKYLNPSRQH